MFNWLNLIQLIPVIVSGVQQLHSGLKGADKKTQAMAYLGLATVTADQFLSPSQAAIANAVSAEIDSVVNLFHATNAPGFGSNSTPAQSPQAATA